MGEKALDTSFLQPVYTVIEDFINVLIVLVNRFFDLLRLNAEVGYFEF